MSALREAQGRVRGVRLLIPVCLDIYAWGGLSAFPGDVEIHEGQSHGDCDPVILSRSPDPSAQVTLWLQCFLRSNCVLCSGKGTLKPAHAFVWTLSPVLLLFLLLIVFSVLVP